MNVALITIGDEVLIGQIINGNAAWIADVVTRIGCRVVEHCTVADQAPQLTQTLDRLRDTCDVLLLTGGLGPTHDDITKPVLADYFNDVLVESDEWMSHLHIWMAARGREVTQRNAGQALVPSTARVLSNPIGTAPGILFERDDVIVVAMPGVPDEMKGIMRDHVVPLLEDRIREQGAECTQYYTMLTTGIAESSLADLIGEPSEFLGSSTLAFLPNYQGVRLRIGVTAADHHDRERERMRIASILRERAGRFIFGHDDQTLSEVVGLHLKERNETIAVAESCTGGLLGAAFTDVPGSSAWFHGGVLTYTNEAKVRELGVSQTDLNNVGAVSEEVAYQMANGVRLKFGTTYGIGITGVAGPDGGSKDKPVGTVWISVVGPVDHITIKHSFGNNRRINRERSVGAALGMLWKIVR
ncbi:MAG: competence/damage-inducible protein A [Ignavibacteria bacterium]|nr:competence/damage-inducible protein A [Ignavibacteria bacterium]MBK7577884.1 competence/damage-inducible protein A [Ignavibacteria bacterium]